MCGIIGLNQRLGSGSFNKAAERFAYRGPDAYGFAEEDEVTLGHHRLSIIDLDPRSHQPMVSNSSKTSIIFNGEIYNFKDIKAKLASTYEFRTTSDTEVLLAAYEAYGTNLTRELRGMYAFAIHDRVNHKFVLFRDPQGIKPLYYAQIGKHFCFASEAKGVAELLKQLGHLATLNEQAWDLFWTFGYVPSPLTLHQSIFKLERGHVLTFDLRTQQLEISRAPEHPEAEPLISDNNFADLTEQVILDHLISDAPVGVYFSGGTDSSLIAAVLHKHGIDLSTFSLVMEGNEVDGDYLRAIRKHLGMKGHIFEFSDQELSEALEIIKERIDEPTSDSSIFPTLFLSQQAAKDVKVVLSGEGGDELFYGYHRQLGLANLKTSKATVHPTLLDRARLLSTSATWQKFLAKAYLAAQDGNGFYLSQMSLLREQTPARLWQLGRERLASLRCNPALIDREIALENDLLRKIDLATSYASIEGRVPLLDPRLIRYAERISGNHLKNNILKHELKRLLKTYLPSNLVDRPKAGFGVRGSFIKKHTGFKQAAHEAWDFLQKSQSFTPEIKGAISNRLSDPSIATALITLQSSLRELGINHE